MDLILFGSVVILAGLIYGGFQVYYNVTHKHKIIDSTILEENVKTGDQYEIIYLKLGEEGAKESAIGHLVESGYLENKEGILKPNPQKDVALLTELEKSLMKSGIGSKYGEFILEGETGPFEEIIKKYEKKAQELHLFYKRGKWLRKIEITVNLFFAFFAVYYIFSGTQLSWFSRLFIIAVLISGSHKLFYEFILEKPAKIQMKDLSGKSVRKYSAAGHILTANGKKYIKLFEEKNFPVDPIIEKYFPGCPCSVFT